MNRPHRPLALNARAVLPQASGLPVGMRKRIGPSPQLLRIGIALAAFATAVVAALADDGNPEHQVEILLIVATAFIAAAFFYQFLRSNMELQRAVSEAEERFAEVYDRAGISIWREDWSAVGAAIQELKNAEVADIPGWFAARPEETRALHAKVRINSVNWKSVELMGALSEAELVGSLADILPGSAPAFHRWIAALSAGDSSFVGESAIQRLNGDVFDCLVTAALPREGEPLTDVIICIVEITKYKRDQADLMRVRDEIARTQRIATVGALTASIAHEVNSPLAAIASNAAACVRWLERSEPDLEEVKTAVAAVIEDTHRAKAVIDRTRSYLQKAPRITEQRDIRGLIRAALQIVENEAHAHEVNLGLALNEELGSINCEPVQLQQALINLMLNGIQAMSKSRVRQLTVRATRKPPHILISIEDTGPGIAPEDLGRIFEPFYSTKDGGMGMGLSICRTIVESHCGTLTAQSSHDTGTRFLISLPDTSG